MENITRRQLLAATGTAGALAGPLGVARRAWTAEQATSDSLSMQLYKSLNDEQREKICLPVDHARRQFISNWWYIHSKHRVNNTFDADQRELIQQIFDSLHHPDYRDAVNKQVELDQYKQEKNAPSVGFFGTPEDEQFEFIYTGHHVTRRCNPHSEAGQGFVDAPIFYGHFFKQFNETKDHPNNPYWYQGQLFNQFVQMLDPRQQQLGLAETQPRSERPNSVIAIREGVPPGLACADLRDEQKTALLTTIEKMLVMFRESDVKATVKMLRDLRAIDRARISWFGGKYDIGSDEVWDTWTIEGPNMVWYFRGQPHIHCYFHLKSS